MIAIYKGKSYISRAIRFFNFSEYSHVAWIDDDSSVIEAWHRGGVTHVQSISDNHTPGTPVRIYSVIGETPEIRHDVNIFLRAQVGLGYDYLAILGFIVRSNRLHRRNRWFCSELVAEAYRVAGLPLVNLPSNKVYPGMLAASPILKLIEETVTV